MFWKALCCTCIYECVFVCVYILFCIFMSVLCSWHECSLCHQFFLSDGFCTTFSNVFVNNYAYISEDCLVNLSHPCWYGNHYTGQALSPFNRCTSSGGKCFHLFRKLEILPLASRYILSLILFVVKNNNLFILNSDNHIIGTRQSKNFYHSLTNFTVYQNVVHCMGIRVPNNLPPDIKAESQNLRKFKNCLKQFLHTHYFYSIEEYFQYKANISYILFK
jgi:hypothetical protein